MLYLAYTLRKSPRKDRTGFRKFFNKGFRDVEFVISCFQSWDTEPSEVLIDMRVTNLQGEEEIVATKRYPMSNLGKIDAVAYKVYYTAIIMEEYQLESRFNRIGRVTYSFTDIGPYLWFSEAMSPQIQFQVFNRYYFKNKLALMGIREVNSRFLEPDLSKRLTEEKFRKIERKKFVTEESLGMNDEDYVRASLEARKVTSAH